MESIKDVVGLGAKAQSGQEPVSGQQGEGSAGAPYDGGNDSQSASLRLHHRGITVIIVHKQLILLLQPTQSLVERRHNRQTLPRPQRT